MEVETTLMVKVPVESVRIIPIYDPLIKWTCSNYNKKINTQNLKTKL